MFSTCEVMPPDAGEPFTNDNIGPLLAAVIAAVRERRDDNGADALDSVSGNREESNLMLPMTSYLPVGVKMEVVQVMSSHQRRRTRNGPR